MEDLNVVDSINYVGMWLVCNQELLLSYVVNIVVVIVILIVGMIVVCVVFNIVNCLMLVCKIDVIVVDFFFVLVCYVVIVFMLIVVLGWVGVQIVLVIVVLGVVGLVVGLVLQGLLLNFVVGVLLVMFCLFCVGEYVDFGGVVGMVLNVQIFFIILCIVDGKVVVVLNGKIIVGNIINFFWEFVCCNEFIIGVVYDVDIDKVKQLLILIIEFDD